MAAARIISGAIAGLPLIDLNGADNITFDGSNNATDTKDLTIRNSSSSGQTFRFINDATNNTVKNTIIEGANTISSSGTIVFSTAVSGTSGNSGNTINNCDVRDRSDAAGVPANAIYSGGSAGAPNAGNTISGCSIFNWTNAGILVSSTGAGNNWIINTSSFFQTASRASALTAISIQGGSGHAILNTNIGGSAPDRSGNPLATTASFSAISLNVGTASATNVNGNKISNLNISGGIAQIWQGINIGGGNVNVGVSSGNTIGGGAAAYDTIRVSYDSRAIYNTGPGIVDIENNVVGNIAYYESSSDDVKGIRVNAGTNTIKNNIIRDIKSNATANATFFLAGIDVRASTGNLVEGNEVYNLAQTNATGGSIITGITVAASGDIRKNKIYNIDATAVSSLFGINALSGSTTYSNNMISISPAGSVNHFIGGIRDDGTNPATNNWYFNSVLVTGTSGAGANNTYAFVRSGTSTISIKNNVFSNTRTGGAGFNVSVANTNAVATGWPATASDNNDLYNPNSSTVAQWLGNGGANNRDLPGWQASQGAGTPGSGGDGNSWNLDPNFTSTTDLHIPAATIGPLESRGVAVGGITTDIDGDTRPGPAGSVNGGATAPDIGADEFDGTPASVMSYVSGTTTQDNVSNTSANAINQEVIGIQIVTSGSLNPLSATSFTFNTNGTTLATDITNAKLWYTGTSSVFATTSQFGPTFANPAGSFIISGSQTLQQGTNYFWLTYDISCTATITDVIDAECNSVNVVSPNIPDLQAPGGNRSIAAGPVSGTKTVGTGGDFATLTEAINTINANGLGGDMTLSILNSITEAGPVVISQWNECGAGGYTLTIKPAATATISANSSTAVIIIDGADKVIIDGSISNTGNTLCPASAAVRDLTIVNTNTGTSSAIVWLQTAGVNGATNNIVKNCNLIGSGNTQTLFAVGSGSSTISTSSFGTGNNNNSFINNNISKTQYGIYSQGASAGNKNTGTVINQNLINTASPDNVRLNGIWVGFENGVQISGNTISNLATTNELTAISVGLAPTSIGAGSAAGNDVTNAVITNNIIGSVVSTSATGYSAAGIAVASVSSGTTLIANNMIAGVTAPSGAGYLAAGIFAAGGTGSVTHIYQNTVSMTGDRGAASYPSYALAVGGSAPIVDIRNNIFVNSQTSIGAGQSYAIGLAYTGATGNYSNLTSNNNDLFTSGSSGALAKVGSLDQGSGANQASLAAWTTETGRDGASKNVQPMFISAANLHLLTPDLTNFNNLEGTGDNAIVSTGNKTDNDIDCDARNTGSPDIGADEFTGAAPTCPDVTGLAASNIAYTSADLNWNVVGGATGYEYAVITSPTPPGSGTFVATNSVSAASLLPSTSYYAHVRADCGGGNFGNWATIGPFTTQCNNAALPLIEGFNTSGASVLPACWSQQTVAGSNDITFEISSDNPATTPYEGTRFVYWNSYNITAGNETRLVSPPITTTGTANIDVAFRWFNENSTSYNGGAYLNEGVQVQYSLDKTTWIDAGALITRADNSLPAGTGQWNLKTVTLPAGAGNQATIYVGFKFHSEFGDNCSMDALDIHVSPTCLPPANLSMLSTSATTATVSWSAPGIPPSNGYEWKIVLTGDGSGGTAVASGSAGAGILSANATGLVTGINYDLFVRSDCGGSFSAWSGPKTYFLNDDAPGAITLTVGGVCSGPYTNVGATKSTNEAYPSCSGTALTPVWFKFVAPASGAVRVSTDLAGVTLGQFEDSKIGLFSVGNPTDYTTFQIESCDEDGGSDPTVGNGDGYMSVMYATGLQPGTTYWIGVDRYNTFYDEPQGTFCIEVKELDNTMIASAANTCSTGIESPYGSNADYKGWVPLLDDADSKLIALVRNPAGGAVEDYSVTVNVNPGAVRTDPVSGQKYLDRNFHIENSGGATNVEVQLFFLNTELTALQAVDPAVTPVNLGVTHQTGAMCQNDFAAANGTNTYIPQTGNGSVNGADWISFTTPGFSNFYLHTSKAPVTFENLPAGSL